MEVSHQHKLKRETYYISMSILDRYMSCTKHIQLSIFQLIGVTSMYIASKIEEVYPLKVEEFAKAASNYYPCELILKTELDILHTLKWYINPPTTNMWTNWYLVQWDLYV